MPTPPLPGTSCRWVSNQKNARNLDSFSHATYDCRPVGEHLLNSFSHVTDNVHLHPTIGEQELDDTSVTCE